MFTTQIDMAMSMFMSTSMHRKKWRVSESKNT